MFDDSIPTIKNIDFQKRVDKVIMEVDLPDLHIERHRSDGDIIENNWEVNTNGEGFEQGINSERLSSLYRELVDKYDQKAEKVRQKYADQYGWGEAGQQATTTKVSPGGLTEGASSPGISTKQKTKRSNARPIRASKKKENN